MRPHDLPKHKLDLGKSAVYPGDDVALSIQCLCWYGRDKLRRKGIASLLRSSSRQKAFRSPSGHLRGYGEMLSLLFEPHPPARRLSGRLLDFFGGTSKGYYFYYILAWVLN